MESQKFSSEWNLSPISQKSKSFEEQRKEWTKLTNNFIAKWRERNDYLESPERLKEALDDYENWRKFYGSESNEFFYYWLKTQKDKNNPELKAKFNNVQEFSKKIENEMKFFQLKIARISKEKQNYLLENPLLKEYKHFLERLFAEAKFLLSEKEEKIINLKSPSAYSSWKDMVTGLLVKEEREILDEHGEKRLQNFSEILSLMSNKDKKIRDIAAKAFNEILERYKEIAENELNAILANKKVDDELRGMERPDFARHLSDDIETEIVEKVIEKVSQRFDISRKYYELKAKLLGVDKLEYHERNIEYGEIDKEYSYEDSIKLTEKVFSKLDSKFSDILKKFIQNSQIDVFPKKGKRQGAFCVYFLITQPTYVMLNHTNKLNDVLTIAHEMGHAINNELIKEKQNSLNFGTPLSTAEVASTFMEDFILEELMNDADDELKLALIMQKLNDDISTIMRQIACYMFEQELHKKFREKGYLSYGEIGELFKKNMQDYMGDYVEQSEGSENWWIYWGHIRTFFYNYSYASGVLISKFMQKEVKKNPKFIEKVKEFLSSGLSKSPKEIFSDMEIDITNEKFWEESLKEVEDLLKEAENLASKLQKI